MNNSHKRVFALLGVLSALVFNLPQPAEADSHASSEAVRVIGNGRGAWRRMRNQARKEERARQKGIQREHQSFERDHKMRFQKESRERQMRLNGHHRKIRNYKWKKQI
ncbi:MAG: hypothetical protein KIT34_07115 [Cyanobacteria bacterium TGS_CYA1]|nr:hypothetical protein [Cyanobacteria bacterium TGS_CYA1]